MARIFGATYTPYTYEELAAPVREATVVHQKVEEEYNNNMLVVDSLRQRAMNEPDAKWSQQILDYADKLEGYAMDLARHGLTRETNMNLLNMKRGFGTTVSPVITAMAREKALQSVRDQQIGNGVVFGKMPTIDEIIANPNIGQSSYDKNDLYKLAHDTAKAMSDRNIRTIMPYNYNAYLYAYGVEKGFSNQDIQKILEDDPGFKQTFGEVMKQSGYLNDESLTPKQINELNNMVVLGALNGFEYDKEIKYGTRKDYLNPLQSLQYKRLKNEDDNSTDFGFYSGPVERKKFSFRTTTDSPEPRKQNQKGDPDGLLRNSVIIDIDGTTQDAITQKHFADNDNTIPLIKYNGVYIKDKRNRKPDHIDPTKCKPVAIEIDNDITGGVGTRVVWQDNEGKKIRTTYFDENLGRQIQNSYLTTSYKMNAEYKNQVNHDGAFKKQNIDHIINNFDDEKLKRIGYTKDEIIRNSKSLDNEQFVYYIDNIASKYYYTEHENAILNGENEYVLEALKNQCMNYYNDMIGYNDEIDFINQSIQDVLNESLSTAGGVTKVKPFEIQ